MSEREGRRDSESWQHQLPEEGPETGEREGDALAQLRSDAEFEHATSLPPAEWHAKWQEDKAEWEVERQRWQEEHAQRGSSGSESATSTYPPPNRESAAPEPAVFSPSAFQPEDKPHFGQRRGLWEPLSRRLPRNTTTGCVSSSHHPH